MIEVCVQQCGLAVTGHANMAPYGSDIVCSAVFALIKGLREIACMELYESVEPGNICIKW